MADHDLKSAEKSVPVDKSGHSFTPGPWVVVDRDGGTYEMLGADGTFLMSDEPYYPTAPDREHAEYIVKCVNAHGKAHPVAIVGTDRDGDIVTRVEDGLTIREHFAAMAMQGLLAGNPISTNPQWEAAVAKLAITHADALLAELAKP